MSGQPQAADGSQNEMERELHGLRERVQMRDESDRRLERLFAPEDAALQEAREAPSLNDMPAIEISPLQGQLLLLLARSIGAKKILEIGALAGYSGIWLARSLPADGRLISLEVSEKHAEVARRMWQRAGVADRAELRVGPAEETLATLTAESPFDLIFIDADKPGYPTYLDWALKLARPGALIVADNCVRMYRDDLAPDATPYMRAVSAYDHRVASDPRLLSVALPIDEGGMDGFAISLVLPSAE
ncbi:MAG: O-methyltransferase [Ktedonobacterales bacterium]